MKNPGLITLLALIIFKISLFGQNTMNKNLNQLFLDLDLDSAPEIMTKKSFLKFDYGENKGVEWTGGNTKMFIAKFDKHNIIESKIKGGKIFIRQNAKESKLGIYEITQSVYFENTEEVLSEFNKLSSVYEENSFKIKKFYTENLDNEITSQYNEIFIKSESKLSKLTIGYSLPSEDGQEPCLVISFKNIENGD